MKKIGILICDTGNPFWQAKIALYESLAAGYGFDAIFRESSCPGDKEGQCRTLFDMLGEGYDAIVANPISEDNLVPAMRQSATPIFDVGPKTVPELVRDARNYFPIVVTDFEAQGRLAGECLAAESGEHADGWALIVGGLRDARHSEARCRGAYRALLKKFPQRRILTAYADFRREEASRLARDVLGEIDGVRCVFCANDLMALGMLDAMDELDLSHRPLVAGVDAIQEALRAVEAGRMLCTVELPHETVVRGVYRTLTDWFDGVRPGDAPVTESYLRARTESMPR